MGALQYLGVPLRRLLHKPGLPQAIIDGELTNIFDTIKKNALGGMIWALLAGIMMALVLVLFLVSLSYLIAPYRRMRRWQQEAKGTESSRAVFKWVWIGAVVLVGLVLIDTTISNVTSRNNCSIVKRKSSTLLAEIANLERGFDKAAEELERFGSSISRAMTRRMSPGQDASRAMELAQDFVAETETLSQIQSGIGPGALRLSQASGASINEMRRELGNLTSSQEMQNIREASQEVKRLLDESTVVKIKISRLDKILETDTEKEIDDKMKLASRIETSRFVATLVLVVLISITVGMGLWCFLRGYRLNALFSIILALLFLLFTLYLAHIMYLGLGIVFGSVCDATIDPKRSSSGIYFKLNSLKTAKKEKPNATQRAKDPNELERINAHDLYTVIQGCQRHGDIIGAFMGLLHKEKKKYYLNDHNVMDGTTSSLNLRVRRDKTLTIPVEEGRTNFELALDGYIDDVIRTQGASILSSLGNLINVIDQVMVRLGRINFALLQNQLEAQQRRLEALTFDDLPPQLRADMTQTRNMLVASLRRIYTLSRQLQNEQSKLKAASMGMQRYLAEAGSPEQQRQRLKVLLGDAMRDMVKDVLRPALSCQQVGDAIIKMSAAVCKAGNAWQSMFLGTGILICSAIYFVIVLFICRRYSPSILSAEKSDL